MSGQGRDKKASEVVTSEGSLFDKLALAATRLKDINKKDKDAGNNLGLAIGGYLDVLSTVSNPLSQAEKNQLYEGMRKVGKGILEAAKKLSVSSPTAVTASLDILENGKQEDVLSAGLSPSQDAGAIFLFNAAKPSISFLATKRKLKDIPLFNVLHNSLSVQKLEAKTVYHSLDALMGDYEYLLYFLREQPDTVIKHGKPKEDSAAYCTLARLGIIDFFRANEALVKCCPEAELKILTTKYDVELHKWNREHRAAEKGKGAVSPVANNGKPDKKQMAAPKSPEKVQVEDPDNDPQYRERSAIRLKDIIDQSKIPEKVNEFFVKLNDKGDFVDTDSAENQGLSTEQVMLKRRYKLLTRLSVAEATLRATECDEGTPGAISDYLTAEHLSQLHQEAAEAAEAFKSYKTSEAKQKTPPLSPTSPVSFSQHRPIGPGLGLLDQASVPQPVQVTADSKAALTLSALPQVTVTSSEQLKEQAGASEQQSSTALN